jgi:ribosomal protein S18 acetylase RimI-like enzyme
MAPTIRVATSADLIDVLSLWREADAEPTHTDDAESLEQLIAHDPGALVILEEDRRIIGSVIAGWDGWRGSVYRLVVAPSHRRMGLGLGLVREAESRLAARGASRMQAVVVESDVPATRFWRASGWEQQADRLRFVKVGKS